MAPRPERKTDPLQDKVQMVRRRFTYAQQAHRSRAVQKYAPVENLSATAYKKTLQGSHSVDFKLLMYRDKQELFTGKIKS